MPIPGNTVLLLQTLDQSDSVVSVKAIWEWTNKDPILAQVRDAIIRGDWKAMRNCQGTSPCRTKQNELSVQDDCVLWANRVVVPRAG